MWDLPRSTHRRFIEPLGGRHAATIIYSNYWKSICVLAASSNPVVRSTVFTCLANASTLTSKNLNIIRQKLGQVKHSLRSALNWDPNLLKFMKFESPKDGDYAKIEAIKELTEIKRGNITLEGATFSDDEINDMLHNACCS